MMVQDARILSPTYRVIATPTSTPAIKTAMRKLDESDFKRLGVALSTALDLLAGYCFGSQVGIGSVPFFLILMFFQCFHSLDCRILRTSSHESPCWRIPRATAGTRFVVKWLRIKLWTIQNISSVLCKPEMLFAYVFVRRR